MAIFNITPRKIRFSIVSSTATAIDFGVLLILTLFGAPLIKSNFVSTSLGFVYSFFANKKYTFRTPDHHIQREAVQYLGITLIGIWVVQPLIIWPIEQLINHLGIYGWLVTVTAKIIASLATFVWNYYFYTRVVFIKKK
jgi:putative flippase GtrA